MKWLERRRARLAEIEAKRRTTEQIAAAAERQTEKVERLSSHASQRLQYNHLTLIFEGITSEGRRRHG